MCEENRERLPGGGWGPVRLQAKVPRQRQLRMTSKFITKDGGDVQIGVVVIKVLKGTRSGRKRRSIEYLLSTHI